MTTLFQPASPPGVPVLRGHSLRHALLAGSRVLTATGERHVETLKPGDRVITRDRGMVRIRALRRSPVPSGCAMVLIPAGAMGRGRPERDVTLPADQPVVLRDWRARTLFGAKEARVAAIRLVDGGVIRRVAGDAGVAWSLVLDRPAAIYADGLELVTGAIDALEA